jgi:iron complex outermembrane receptor protein
MIGTLAPATLVLLLGTVLHAQDPEQARRDSADAARRRALPPIVVSVVRVPLSMEQAPIAVATTTAAEIRSGRQGLALDEALRAIPGVQVDNRFNYAVGERIAIRGFGARSQFGVRGLRVLVDGIPATLPDGQTNLNHVDLGSLGRAEVIRGPASALYGNAAGGVLLFETEAAPGVPVSERLRVTSGGSALRLQSVTAGTADAYSYLVSVAHLDAGGHRVHDEARVTTLTGRLERELGAGSLQFTVSGVDYDAKNPGSLTDSLLRVDRHQAFRNNVIQKTGENGRQGQLGARWRGDVRIGTIELSAHALAREVDNPIPPRIIDLTRSAGGLRAVLQQRLQPAERRAWQLGWSGGVEAQLQRDTRLNFVNDSGRRAATVLDQRERVSAVGPFALLWADFGSRVSALAGLRYDRQQFRADDRLVSATNPDDSGERMMSALSPSAGVSAELLPGVRLYGNVATAFETPTTSELANRASGAGGFNPDLAPQRTTSIEAGLNARLGTLAMVQAAAYRARVRDALVPFEVPGAPGRQFFRNAGEATHRGAELWLRTTEGRMLVARGAYTHTSARFENGTTGGINLAGRRVPGIAPHRTDGSLELAPLTRLRVALDARYVSAMPADDANVAISPPYAVADVRAWLMTRGHTWLAPFLGVSNLLDRDYNASVVINAAGRRYFEPGPGRTFYAGLEAGWARR